MVKTQANVFLYADQIFHFLKLNRPYQSYQRILDFLLSLSIATQHLPFVDIRKVDETAFGELFDALLGLIVEETQANLFFLLLIGFSIF